MGSTSSEERIRASRDYTNTVEVRIVADGEEATVSGTTIGPEPRLFLGGALGFGIDIELAPHMVFVRYADQPGVIGRVGSMFGDAGVNIANMAVSRTKEGGEALMVFSIDTPATGGAREGPARDGLRRRALRRARMSAETRVWPEPVERVASFLREVGAEARLEELPQETPTAEGAADAIGCTLSQIVKSLVLVCDDAPVVALVPGDRRADTGKVARIMGVRRAAVASAARGARGDRASVRAESRPSRSSAWPRCSSTARSSGTAWCGPGRAPTATSSGCRRPSSCASRAVASRTSCSNHHNPRQAGANGGDPMQETAKIWMNGELVDWADATVHVGVHGLHYGTGAFEGIRAYETPRGPAVFRLADHLQRLHDSARLLYMDIPFTVEELRDRDARPRARERPPGLLPPADRLLRLRLARRAHARQPGRDGDHELALGRVPRRGLAREGHHGEDLVLDAGRAERDPARREGDRHLPQLDARHDRGAARRLRRGDPAHRRRASSPTAPARTSSSSRTAGSRRRRSRPRSCPGSPATP